MEIKTRVEMATELRDELFNLASACVPAVQGNADAIRLLESRIDSHWHALVIGRSVVEQMLSAEE